MKNIASPYLRLLAHLIDISIAWMPGILLLVSISASTDIVLVLNRASLLVLFIVYPIFYTVLTSLMISMFGGTFGKLLTGTRIVDSGGNYLSFWRATWRNLIGYIVSGLVLWAGFIWIIIDKNRRGWHDMMADSYVILRNKWMFVVGTIVLGFLLFVQFSLVKKSIYNFKSNLPMYTQIYTEIKTDLKEHPLVEE